MAAAADLAGSEKAAESTAFWGQRKLGIVNPNERKEKVYKQRSGEYSMAPDRKMLVLRVADTAGYLKDQYLVYV